MHAFPVSNSTLSPVHVAQFIEASYGAGSALTARIIKTGISDTYMIDGSNGKYVFRVYSLHWRTILEIEEELRLLQILKENNIPVSFPIPDKKGSFIQSFQAPEGLRYGVLFSFARGEKMLNIPAPLHQAAGKIIAGMHRVTHNMQLQRVEYTPDVLLVDSLQKLAAFLPAASAEMQYMQRLQHYLLGSLKEAGTTGQRKGVVHLDIWFDNLVIHEQKDITLFDFDFCGNGPLLLDIAYYLLQLFSTEKDETELKEKQEQFLQGYESVTAISPEEKALLPAAGVSLYFFYLGVQCSRFDNWSNNFLNEIYLKRFINLLIKKWADYHQLRF